MKTILIVILCVIALVILSCDDNSNEGFWGGYYGNSYPYYGNNYPYYGNSYPYYGNNYSYYGGNYMPWYRRYIYPSYWGNSLWY